MALIPAMHPANPPPMTNTSVSTGITSIEDFMNKAPLEK
jgi:hypothetical protein